MYGCGKKSDDVFSIIGFGLDENDQIQINQLLVEQEYVIFQGLS